MANHGVYIPWEQLKSYIPIPTNQTRDDALLFALAMEASAKFDAHCFRRFYPTLETRYFDYCDPHIIELNDDLLAVNTLTTQNGSSTITSNDYLLMTGNHYTPTPHNRIMLKTDGSVTTFSYSGSTQRSNAITGFWGYHEDWVNAWQDSQDTTENNPLSSSGTSITVNDVDGAGLYGLGPRFMVQQLIRIESEYLFITGKNTTANTLTVIRGVNGTTAAAHNQNTIIYIYQPMAAIVTAMQVLATYIYRRRDSIGSSGDTGTAANGVLTLPSRLPEDVTDMINVYKRWTTS